LIDSSLLDELPNTKDEQEQDNIRVFIPMDINHKAILRRIRTIILKYGEANERNELSFLKEIEAIVAQTEIYDQIWFARTVPQGKKHSEKGTALIREVVSLLREIPDGGAEIFPFELIESLEIEYK
jgi:hypothetical protein